MPSAAIVGAGLIGRSWAIVFARAGWEVRLTDPSAEALEDCARTLSARRSTSSPPTTSSTIRPRRRRESRVAGSLAEAVVRSRLCRRTGRSGSRRSARIFAELDRGGAARRDPRLLDLGHRRLAVHGGSSRTRALPRRPSGEPAAPRADRRALRRAWTSPEMIARARAIYDGVDQAPITVNREIDGFVLNRLQVALLAEAFRLVGEGVRLAAGPRQDARRRARAALVVHGAVRDDRAQRARRHPGLLRALRRFLLPRHRRPAEAGGVGRATSPASCRHGAGRPRKTRFRAAPLARQAPHRAHGAQARATGYRVRSPQNGKARKVIITCAVTGAIHTPSMSPHPAGQPTLAHFPSAASSSRPSSCRACSASSVASARIPKTWRP